MTAAAARHLYLVPPLSEITTVDTDTAIGLAHAKAVADIAEWFDRRHLELVITVVDGTTRAEIEGDPESSASESFRVQAQAHSHGRWKRTLRASGESREYLREEFCHDSSAFRSAEAGAIEALLRAVRGR
ncbi:hypothetical protein SEA_DOGGS_42 [Gordonia phage Doggs]|nr:hypothetical protein SEA_DOGGS_42 [Gordonia phage Doggs]